MMVMHLLKIYYYQLVYQAAMILLTESHTLFPATLYTLLASPTKHPLQAPTISRLMRTRAE